MNPRQGIELELPRPAAVFAQADEVEPVETDRADHVAFRPSWGIAPFLGQLERDLKTVMVGLYFFRLRGAERNDGTQPGPRLDWWRNDNAEPPFDHFRHLEALIEIGAQDRAALGVVANRQR